MHRFSSSALLFCFYECLVMMALRTLIFTVLNASHFQFKDSHDLQRWILSLIMALAILIFLHVVTSDKSGTTVGNAAVGLTWATLYALPVVLFNGEKQEKSLSATVSASKTPEVAGRKSKKKKRRSSTTTIRKSKHKNMTDQNEAPARISPEKTKFYDPLPTFLELNMDPQDLYGALLPHVLLPKQLLQCGFPTAGPGPPDRRSSLFEKVPDNPDERRCCRCGEKFFVTTEGSYEATATCRYHIGKMTSFNGIPGAGPYACCNGNYLSEGCATHIYHVSAQTFLDDNDFTQTRDKRYQNPKQSRSVYALDCEMCYTTRGIEVAKVGLVGLDGLTVFDSYVLPKNRVLDYNTTYSGVTANCLKNVSTTLVDVQTFLLKLINKNTILVGHGLENDLRALRIVHQNVVDTSIVFPHVYGHRYKRSLKSLAADYLQKSIQQGDNGHNCIEDARTCMELVLYKVQSEIKARQSSMQLLRELNSHPVRSRKDDCNKMAQSSCSRQTKSSSDFYVGYLVPGKETCCCRD